MINTLGNQLYQRYQPATPQAFGHQIFNPITVTLDNGLQALVRKTTGSLKDVPGLHLDVIFKTEDLEKIYPNAATASWQYAEAKVIPKLKEMGRLAQEARYNAIQPSSDAKGNTIATLQEMT
jgi:hypothetical protein